MRKILIVDADDQVTAVLELKLRQQGYDVKALSKTVNAIKVVKEFSPDLIISEMELPELSGVDFLKRVKMNPETMSIPFIFLSSSRNVEDKILAHEMGAEAFFMKPIFIKVLIHRINDFFDQEKFNELLSSSKNKKEFKGDLSSISVIDILNIISENKSSGVVELSSSSEKSAEIFFINGAVTRIETEGSSNKNGVDELFRILSWLDGNFTINYKEVDVPRNVRVPHDRLLVKAANWLDDYTSELSDMPPLDSMLYFNPGKFLKEINRFPDNISIIIRSIGPEGSRFSDIIERAELDRKQTVNSLKEMLELGVVSVEKRESGYKLPKEPSWLTGKEPDEGAELDSLLDNFGSEEPDQKEDETPMETLVPPPSFAQKDTIDPVEGISFENLKNIGEKQQIKEVSAPSLLNSDELKLDEDLDVEQPEESKSEVEKQEDVAEQVENVEEVEEIDVDLEENSESESGPEDEAQEEEDDVLQKKEEEFDQKTEIINTVSDEDELKSIMQEHLEDVELEKDINHEPKEKSGGAKAVIAFLIVALLGLGGWYFYFKMNKTGPVEDKKVEKEEPVKEEPKETLGVPVKEEKAEVVKKEEKAPENKDPLEAFSKDQKELLKLDVAKLNDKAAELYAKEMYQEAVKVNEVALYKIKNEGGDKGEIYEKVVMNMAIYLYMQEENKRALKFAEESISLKGNAKSIELKVAILEALGKNIDAASFLREKISNKTYSDKKKEWMREINRLEKIKR